MQSFYDIQIQLYELLKMEREKKILLRSGDEEYGLKCLLRYLNSGDKRSYKVVSRPDKEESNSKRPDFICKDQMTGAEITVEITQILSHPDRLKAQAHRRRIWYETAKLVEGKLPGGYQFTLPLKLNTRGLTVNQLAQTVIHKAANMKVGDKIQLERDLELSKLSDEGSFLSYVEARQDENDDDPIDELMNFAQVIHAIKTPLQEANEKFDAFSKGVRILLLDCRSIPLDILDVSILSDEITLDQYPSIDRIYLLNTPSTGNILRFK